jgi:hypothetical protein
MPIRHTILLMPLAAPAMAQPWQPDRPVRRLVLFAAGANADLVARLRWHRAWRRGLTSRWWWRTATAIGDQNNFMNLQGFAYLIRL